MCRGASNESAKIPRMKHTFLFRFLSIGLFSLSLMVSLPVSAKSGSQPDAAIAADWEQRLEQARREQADAAQKKSAAKVRFETERLDCFDKFRVSDCQEEARQRYQVSTNEARRLENKARATERQVNKEKFQEKAERYRTEEPLRQADRTQRQQEVAQEHKRREERKEQKQAEKQEKAEQGAVRRAREAKRLDQKKIRHDQKVAEQMEKARQREARSLP